MNKFGTVIIIFALAAFITGVVATVCYAYCQMDMMCYWDCIKEYGAGYCKSVCTYCQ